MAIVVVRSFAQKPEVIAVITVKVHTAVKVEVTIKVPMVEVNIKVFLDMVKNIKCSFQHHQLHRHRYLRRRWQTHFLIMEVPWFLLVILVMAMLKINSTFSMLNMQLFLQVRGKVIRRPSCTCSGSHRRSN
jgi:hypothetical protein